MRNFLRFIFAAALLAMLSPAAWGQKNGAQNARVQPQQQKNQPQKQQPAKKNAPVPAPPKISAADTMSTFRGKVMGRFMDLYTRGISEKIYLQTDKPYYSVGDTIWIKGHLVNAATHVPNMPTRYVYAELVSFSNELIDRVKIKADSLYGFYSFIGLKSDLMAGEYVLRGYTQWLYNEGPEFFFSRPVRISNPDDMDFTAGVSYRKTEDGKAEATVTLSRGGVLPIANQEVNGMLKIGNKETVLVGKTDIHGRFVVPFNIARGNGSILIETDMGGEDFSRASFRLPDYTTDYEVQFMPEGGALLAGTMQRVAFKALSINGLSTEIEGKLYNPQGEEMADVASLHKGMGYIAVAAAPGERFYVIVKNKEGIEKRFDLPEPVEAGYALKVVSVRERLICDVAATPGAPLDSLAIVAHIHGRIFMAEDYRAGQPKVLSTERLSPGIISFTLVHKRTLEPLSQRVAFVADRHRTAVAFTPGKAAYGKREMAEVKIALSMADGRPVTGGQFAVSVTDRSTVKWDSVGGNINSYLLLSSDLKGLIENPGEYFIDDSPARAAKLDLLMMTQGWTRFEMSDLLAGTLPAFEFGHEESQTISGKVTGFWGGVANGAELAIFAPKASIMDRVPLDNKLYFHLTGLDYPEKTDFVLQALMKSGVKRSLSLDVDKEFLPGVTAPLLPLRPSEATVKLPDAFLEQSRKRYIYVDETGMTVVGLEEIVVHQKAAKSNLLFGVEATKSFKLEDMEEKFAGQSIREILADMYPRAQRAGGGGVHVYIDDFPAENDELDRMYAEQIETMDIITGGDVMMFGVEGIDAVVVLLKSRSGTGQHRVPLSSLVVYRSLGYRKPAEFYQPKYEVVAVRDNKTPDTRTTLLWEPKIRFDAEGMATVSFYTGDDATAYDVILEGVTDTGEICRGVGTVVRK